MMKLSAICNLVGSALVVTGIIIHIVCLATPYYSTADLSKLKDDIKGNYLSDNDIKELLLLAENNIKIHYGLWNHCHTAKLAPIGDCKTWDDDVNPGGWLKGAQAMAILGLAVMVKGGIGAVLNLFVESRGDRLRILPNIICGFCIFGGVITFCGDIIVAAKYKSVQDLFKGERLSSAAKSLLGNEFTLSWGFGLDILSVIFACLGGALHLVARCTTNSSGLV